MLVNASRSWFHAEGAKEERRGRRGLITFVAAPNVALSLKKYKGNSQSFSIPYFMEHKVWNRIIGVST